MNSLILYKGISQLDNKTPIICVVTGLNYSTNSKTGNMLQTYIMREDMNPVDAVKNGEDAPICGTCKYKSGEGCYVNVGNSVNQIYKAYKRGKYRMITRDDWKLFEGRNIRVGSYGAPSAIPYLIWFNVLRLTKNHTSYSHEWRSLGPQWQFAMASVDTEEERLEAQAKGWRTFGVITDLKQQPSNEIICPATPEGGNKSVCSTCLLCSGNRSKGKNINVVAHGLKWKIDRVKKAQDLAKLETVNNIKNLSIAL